MTVVFSEWIALRSGSFQCQINISYHYQHRRSEIISSVDRTILVSVLAFLIFPLLLCFVLGGACFILTFRVAHVKTPYTAPTPLNMLCSRLVWVHVNSFLLAGTPMLSPNPVLTSLKHQIRQKTNNIMAFCWPSLYLSRKIATAIVYRPCTMPLRSSLFVFFFSNQ